MNDLFGALPQQDRWSGPGFDDESAFIAAFASRFDGSSTSRGERLRITWIESPVGPLIAAASDEGIALLEFNDQRRLDAQFKALARHFPESCAFGEHRHFTRLRRELAEYFAGQRRGFSLPLTFPGSTFQRTVWSALLAIPYGETRSYDTLARSIGHSDACRAVGTTNGRNRISILIPCHRVLNKSGQLGGYGGGLWRKQFLLDLERHSKPASHPHPSR